MLAAGLLPGWRRAALSVSFDGGESWQDAGSTAAPAVIGSAASALTAGSAALFDAEGSVEVVLPHGAMQLLSRHDEALVGGANLALLGEELIQFGRAEEVGAGRYLLSRLLRGRRGTEWAMGSHRAGEGFALICAESLALLELPQGIGLGAEIRVLASGVADAEPVAAGIIATGEALRPPSQVHLRAWRAEAGWLVTWVRRSRLGWSWPSGADTPLGEETERYVSTLTGASTSRSLEVMQPAYFYPDADREGAGPVTLAVAQLGTHAASRPTAITID